METPAVPPLEPTMIEPPAAPGMPVSQMPTFVPDADKTQMDQPMEMPRPAGLGPIASPPSEQETLAMPPPSGPTGSPLGVGGVGCGNPRRGRATPGGGSRIEGRPATPADESILVR